MEKLSPRRKLEILGTYYNVGFSIRETERAACCSHHSLPGILYWFSSLTEREVHDLAAHYRLPAAPLAALRQSASKPESGMARGHIKILDIRVGDWKGEEPNVVRRFITLHAEAVGGDVLLEPAILSFPGRPRANIILHYAGTPYSSINQPSVVVHPGEPVRVDIACTDPIVDPGLAFSAITSGEVYCDLYYQPSKQAQGTGCYAAHPVALAHPAWEDKPKNKKMLPLHLKPFHLEPGNYGVKVTLPHGGGGVSAFLRISSPAEAHGLRGELTHIEK